MPSSGSRMKSVEALGLSLLTLGSSPPPSSLMDARTGEMGTEARPTDGTMKPVQRLLELTSITFLRSARRLRTISEQGRRGTLDLGIGVPAPSHGQGWYARVGWQKRPSHDIDSSGVVLIKLHLAEHDPLGASIRDGHHLDNLDGPCSGLRATDEILGPLGFVGCCVDEA